MPFRSPLDLVMPGPMFHSADLDELQEALEDHSGFIGRDLTDAQAAPWPDLRDTAAPRGRP
ncbi:hypothetical protein [Rhodovulum marinum]|uniref:Uncharacterized protein n=1 Tax=Rhodovulum marinum TaxID=320662 RepID=A0A4R2QBP3_9RHOB|nr:hypothetical protein [Rhodovulum marinum]TCP44295.1 hypothetical protein EV662_101387 [Rhodovulum marinum]